MDEHNNSIALLHSILQPRRDWFAITRCYPALKEAIYALIHTGDHVWDCNELHALHEQIENNTLNLPSAEGLGSKGIYGDYPIHGAIYNLSTKANEYEKRAWLLSHVITAASQWRSTLVELEEGLDTPESIQARKDKKKQYQSQLESACKVVRLIKKDRLDTLLSPPTKTDTFHAHLKTLTKQNENVNVEEISNRYIKDLERFFAYAFDIRTPKKRQQELSPEKINTIKKVRLSLSLDNDPDIEKNDASGKQIHFLETTEEVVNDDGEVITVDRQNEIRSYGLSLLEERASVEAFQSHQSVSPARGDSTQQAILRSRAQLQHRAKSAQLLPERWEQLSTFDIQCLRRAIDTLGSPMPKTLTSVIIMVLISGRPLEQILDAHVVEHNHEIPEALRDNVVYFANQDRTWTAKTITPEGRRQVKSEWKSLMRKTDNRLTLPLTPFFWEISKHSIERAAEKFNHRSVPLFSDARKAKIHELITTLISDARKNDGARLTIHRLGMHLFNILNRGSHDMADTCLITGRLPSMGHQSALYYYAPSKHYLEKKYCQALTVIAKQWSRHGEDVQQHCETNVNAKTDRPLHIGSEIVPTSNYVGALVKHLVKMIKKAKENWCGTQSLIEFHNQYTAYVIAMLMFSTGYRSVRDPVPKEAHINLRRGVIVIADKINDSHSHARMLPLPPLMIEQYERYQHHRRHLLRQLNTFIQEDWVTPFWFMDSLAKPVEVTPRRLQDRFNWPGSPPLNANRHYLRTHLCEKGVPGEYVNAFMGHWDSGQTPWDRYSTFCPRRYRHAVTTVINQLLVTQGWKAIRGYV